MRIFILTAVGSGMLIVAASCTGAGTSGASAGDASSSGAGGNAIHALVDKFCNDVAGPFCEADWACCLAPGGHFGQNVEDCKSQFTTNNKTLWFCNPPGSADRDDLEDSLRAGTTTFDATQFEKCLALLKSMAPGGAACVEPPGYVARRVCLTAFQGQIPPGERCTWQDTLFWDSVVQCKDSRCETAKCIPFLKVGDACEDVDWANPAFMQCNYSQYERCRPAPDAGDGGICAPMGALGDACDVGQDHNDECKSWNCDRDAGTCILPNPYNGACEFHAP